MHKRSILSFTMLAIAAAAATGLLSSCGSSTHGPKTSTTRLPVLRPAKIPPGTTTLTVGQETGRPIPAGFLGLSFEYPAMLPYAGYNPNAINPVFEQLIRNLNPGQRPNLRIGGDSTDWTWWPTPGLRRPHGVRVTLSPLWLQVVSALTKALNARVLLGIDLEANSQRLAATEARELVAGIGASSVQALELGNEPELYGSFAWYVSHSGHKVYGRHSGYDFTDFVRDFRRVGAGLPRLPLAGPATGAQSWMIDTPQLVASAARLRVVTLHRYPLQYCYMPAASPMYPTIGHLFEDLSSRGLADSVVPYVRLAHARGLQLRIDEMNSTSCGGAPGISNAFVSALWALDAVFQMARVGVDGVNIHTFPGATYQLFSFNQVGGTWRAHVDPEYYGLMMFAQAAPPGSRLLQTSGPGPAKVRAWATRGRDGRTRVLLINEYVGQPKSIALRIPGTSGNATLERLLAPHARAKNGVTLGGQSFGLQTTTGTLAGRSQVVQLAPVGGKYVVGLPPASAVLLTLG